MERLIFMILGVLLLTGCGVQPAQETAAPTQTPTEPTGYYAPDSLAEEQTAGAVRAYPLPYEDCQSLGSVDGRLLLVHADGSLTPVDGENGVPGESVETGAQPDSITFSLSGDRVSCYCQEKNQVVLLDSRLVEYSSIDMPEDISGQPWVSMNTGEIFFCRAQEVRALNMETGISRLLFTHSYPSAELAGCYLNGALLALNVADGEGNVSVLYLRAENGETVHESDVLYDLSSWDTRYLLGRMDGTTEQWLFGDGETEPSGFNVTGTVYDLLSAYAAVSCNTDDGCAVVDYYDLADGLRTAAVTIPDVSNVVDIICLDRYVWILGQQDGGLTLYRWDPVMSPVADDTVYTGPLYTPENPDREGLAACGQRAQRLGDAYGITVRVWEDAVENTGGYALTPEYQTAVIHRLLDELEAVLLQFPEGFLGNTIRGGTLQVSLVRGVEDGLDSCQFYSGGDAYIVIASQADVTQAFVRGLSYVVDSHVLGNSRDYDSWNELNPEGFSYASTYDWEPDETASAYLQEGSRYFTESLAMTYPHEDRSSLFVYAMLPGNEAYFTENTMQEKLCRLCEGIREAYGMEKMEVTLPWEQYLTLEMNYSNK